MRLVRKLKTALALIRAGNGAAFGAALSRTARSLRVSMTGESPFVYRSPLGFPFVCQPRSATSVHQYVTKGRYEEIEVSICSHWLEEGDCAIDVGANVGVMTVAFANAVGKGKVVAVEAIRDLADRLKSTLDLLGLSGVSIENRCVSDKPGNVRFMVPKARGKDPHASMRVSAEAEDDFIATDVTAETLDHLVEAHALAHRLALVKIDIEGAEPLALRGATRILESVDPPMFLVEIHQGTLANFASRTDDVVRFFGADRFALYLVARQESDGLGPFGKGQLELVADPNHFAWPYYANLFAVPKVGRFRSRLERVQALRLAGGPRG